MLDDYLKTNPGVEDLPQLGIEPQPPSPQSDDITIRPWQKASLDIDCWTKDLQKISLNFLFKIINYYQRL